MKTHIEGHIYGKVQGVFFRDATRDFARTREIAGLVRNEPDGSVYIEAEGETEQLETLRQWLEHGPSEADVDRVELHEGIFRDYQNFTAES